MIQKREKQQSVRIGITLGDPGGIGPEITAKALSSLSEPENVEYTLLGDQSVYQFYQKDIPENVRFYDHGIISNFSSPQSLAVPERGRASYAYLKTAVDLLKNGGIQSVVTAPVNKHVIIESGFDDFRGHTEMFAEAFKIKRVEMMFVGGPYKTIIATRHIPLSQVSAALTPEALEETIMLADQCLKKTFCIPSPKIALCGINPHAGEGGRIGCEETDRVLPAVKKCLKNGINVAGPYAADTLFIPFNAQQYDLIIAMYHDQGLTPIKAMYFTRLVNFTAGLPFIRTSTAHGTAEDIAGQNKADYSSMKEAVKLACELTAKHNI